MSTGKVWLVGAGPGDIGLFTLKGMEVLRQAQVVVYDSLVGQSLLSRIPDTARCINVGKRASHHTMPQEQINELLAEEAKKRPSGGAPERGRSFPFRKRRRGSRAFSQRRDSL